MPDGPRESDGERRRNVRDELRHLGIEGTALIAAALILLDTNAVLFLVTGHRRAKALARHAGRLYFTSFAMLEMQFLQEAGRGAFTSSPPADAVHEDPRWTVDDPPLEGVVRRAMALIWTRDPFDCLITAHALYRGWRLATSDSNILRNLPESSTLSL